MIPIIIQIYASSLLNVSLIYPFTPCNLHLAIKHPYSLRSPLKQLAINPIVPIILCEFAICSNSQSDHPLRLNPLSIILTLSLAYHSIDDLQLFPDILGIKPS